MSTKGPQRLDPIAAAERTRDLARALEIDRGQPTPTTIDDAKALAEIKHQAAADRGQERLQTAIVKACERISYEAAPFPLRHRDRLIARHGGREIPKLPTPEFLRMLADELAAVEPLTDSEQAVLDYIRANPRKSGKEICCALDISAQSTFTRHIVPKLRPHGLKNRRGAGYFVES